MSPSQLDVERLRVRAGDAAPSASPGFATLGCYELCPQPDSPYPLGLPGRHLLLEEAKALDASDPLDGVFERISIRLGVASNASDRETTGLMLVLVDNLDPAREDEFNRWYDEVHAPDILSAGSFHRVSRYRAVAPAPVAAYLAIYETDWPDPAAAREAMETRPSRAELWDAISAVHLAVYRRH